MGPSKKHQEDALEVRRRDRAEEARQLEEARRRQAEAERRAKERKK